MQTGNLFPQHPGRLHLQREIRRAPAPAPPRTDSRASGHGGRLRTRSRLPPAWPSEAKGNNTPSAARQGGPAAPGRVCALPQPRRAPGAQPPARERAARPRAEATLAARVASPESGSAPLLRAGGGGDPPPLGPTLWKEAGRSSLASPAVTSARPAPPRLRARPASRSRLLLPVRAVLCEPDGGQQ